MSCILCVLYTYFTNESVRIKREEKRLLIKVRQDFSDMKNNFKKGSPYKYDSGQKKINVLRSNASLLGPLFQFFFHSQPFKSFY